MNELTTDDHKVIINILLSALMSKMEGTGRPPLGIFPVLDLIMTKEFTARMKALMAVGSVDKPLSPDDLANVIVKAVEIEEAKISSGSLKH